MQDVYKGVDFDPTDDHHAPWQSGMTGLGYDTAVTGELTSLASLWEADRQVEGQGHVPDRDAGHDRPDAAQARQGSRRRRPRPTLTPPSPRSRRRSTPGSSGPSRATSMRRTSSPATSSWRWPGQATSSPSRRRRRPSPGQLPDEGGMLWTDNMLVPKGAQHKYTAELFIDFVYDPAIAAQIAAWVNYVTPVKGAKEALAADGSGAGREPADLPAGRGPGERQDLQDPDRRGRDVLQRQVLGRHRQLGRTTRVNPDR